MRKDVEIWKDIIGYEGLYKVSNWGRVKSLNYRRTGKERILRPVKDKGGYLVVNLYKNECKAHKIHRLVATAFIENPDNKPQINHLSEVKTDNHYSNLCWATPKDNINWGSRNERVAKAKSKPIQGVDPKSGKIVVEFSSMMEAERNGYAHNAISHCCRGDKHYKTHKGLIWRYK